MGNREIRIPKDELERLYRKQNFSIRKLAKIYACGATTIQRKLHKYNIQTRPSMSVRLNIPSNKLRFLYQKQQKSSTKVAKIYSCSYSTILNRLREYNIKIRDISEAHIRYPKRDFSKDLIEKAYLIGFRLGDLHVRKYEKNGKIISAECASTHTAQITLIQNLFRKYGYVHISTPDKKGITRIQCSLNPTFNFLLNKEDRIESWILSNDKLFFAFLAGYIDAEGDLGVYSRNTASLRVGTCDKNILSQAQDKLINKGIDARLTLDRPKGSKVNLSKWDKCNMRRYKTQRDFWRLGVYKKKALLRLLNRIGPYLKHPRMKNGLLEVRKNIYLRNQEFGNLRMA